MDIKEFERQLFLIAKNKGFQCMELCYQKSSSFSVNIFNGEIYQYKNTENEGVGFRGIFNDNMCNSYSEKLDLSVIELLIENAIVNSQLIEDLDKEKLFAGSEKYEKIENEYSESLNTLTTIDKVNLAKQMEKLAYAVDSRVKRVNSSVVGNLESYMYISNSLGLNVSSKSNMGYGYCYVNVEQMDDVKVGIEQWVGKDWKDFNIENVANKSVEKALALLGAKSIPTCKVPVILDNESATQLLNVYVQCFFGEVVQKRLSKLENKINAKIASDLVTINDDSNKDGCVSNSSFDGEGVGTYNKVIVQNGVLKTYLHNTKSAFKDNVLPTGNGYRASYKSSISTGTNNFYISPSKVNMVEMMSGIKYGVKIVDLAGLHAGVNTLSGDFSLSAKGFLIENGVITKPVEQITVSGNFFDMLLNISGVCNDLKFDAPSSMGAIGSPSILVSELSISGL